MFIFHGALVNGSLAVWAEKKIEMLPTKQKGRQSKNAPPRPHPFAANGSELLEALKPFDIEPEDFSKGLILLPSTLQSCTWTL